MGIACLVLCQKKERLCTEDTTAPKGLDDSAQGFNRWGTIPSSDLP
jgi:hypothetical protein